MTAKERELERELNAASALMSAWVSKQKRLERQVRSLERSVERLELKMAAMQPSGVQATDGGTILDVA